MHRSRKTDQRSHFQTLDSSCRSSAKIKEIRSKCTDQGKPIKEAISKQVRRSRKTDQRIHFQTGIKHCTHYTRIIPVDQVHRCAQITWKPIKETIFKLWTVPVVQVQRSRKPGQSAQINGFHEGFHESMRNSPSKLRTRERTTYAQFFVFDHDAATNWYDTLEFVYCCGMIEDNWKLVKTDFRFAFEFQSIFLHGKVILICPGFRYQ